MGPRPRSIASRWIATTIGLTTVACARSTPDPAAGVPAPTPAATAPGATATAQPDPVEPDPASGRTVSTDDAGRCDPLPKQGEACGERDGWCIVDWGEPGGHSTALWCREGRWEIESEVNLPADDGVD